VAFERMFGIVATADVQVEESGHQTDQRMEEYLQ